jgi:hypothetical protein
MVSSILRRKIGDCKNGKDSRSHKASGNLFINGRVVEGVENVENVENSNLFQNQISTFSTPQHSQQFTP